MCSFGSQRLQVFHLFFYFKFSAHPVSKDEGYFLDLQPYFCKWNPLLWSHNNTKNLNISAISNLLRSGRHSRLRCSDSSALSCRGNEIFCSLLVTTWFGPLSKCCTDMKTHSYIDLTETKLYQHHQHKLSTWYELRAKLLHFSWKIIKMVIILMVIGLFDS